MALKLIAEGIILIALLIIYCLIGIRGGAVGMVFLYDKKVQDRSVELGLITREAIRKNAILFKAIGIASYAAYAIICAYVINGAQGFLEGFWQILTILLICSIGDRLIIDELWVCRTRAWVIPGTEEFMPYISRRDKCRKWIFGTVGMAVIAAVLSGIMTIFGK